MTRGQRVRSWVGLLAVCASAVALLVALPSTVAPTQSAAAVTAADWRAGNIIDDATFYNSNAMGAGEIQAFMQRQVPNCRAGFTCLKDYRQNTSNRPADRYCNGYTGAANESASTIIDRVARSCGISQKVILVILQKEQGLVTSTAPTDRMYSAALGQGCPDTAPCDPNTAGFFFQVYYAARQYEIYRLNPTSFAYQAGKWNNILYHHEPARGCGSQRVYIENQATAGLYIYTPYVPNASALNNMYGTGDNCASYGNRNFWRLYNDWFGTTDRTGYPVGSIELFEPITGGFRIAGWARDPDTVASIQVHVYVGGNGTPFIADLARPDVAAAFPGAGPAHGFDVRVAATPGESVRVCTFAINAPGVGRGDNTELDCRSTNPKTGSPEGAVDEIVAVEGGVRISGWAVDPDAKAPVVIHAHVDSYSEATTADLRRPDLGNMLLSLGTDRGFTTTIGATPGDHRVCVYALNTGPGGPVEMACRQVTIEELPQRGRAPFGAFDGISVRGGKVDVSGWAIDPDTAAPIAVHAYVGTKGVALQADRARADIGRIYRSYGPEHGFFASMDAPRGRADVCVYAINDGPGNHAPLGCKTVDVPGSAPPFGSLELAQGLTGGVRVAGWAVDPDTSNPIQVHVYVDQASVALKADLMRPDVERAFPGRGSRHGYDRTMPASPGPHRVCTYAINDAVGDHALLGCTTLIVK